MEHGTPVAPVLQLTGLGYGCQGLSCLAARGERRPPLRRRGPFQSGFKMDMATLDSSSPRVPQTVVVIAHADWSWTSGSRRVRCEWRRPVAGHGLSKGSAWTSERAVVVADTASGGRRCPDMPNGPGRRRAYPRTERRARPKRDRIPAQTRNATRAQRPPSKATLPRYREIF